MEIIACRKRLGAARVACCFIATCAMSGGVRADSSIVEEKAFLQLMTMFLGVMPFTHQGIESLLNRHLNKLSENSYSAINIKLPGQLAIKYLDLREVEGGGNPRQNFLSIDIEGKCIPYSIVSQHYPNLDMHIPSPHGAQDTPLYFSISQKWGRLSFGFSTTTRFSPDCLSVVVFDGSE